MRSFDRRVRALEQRFRPVQPFEDIGINETARQIAFVLARGVNAREKLDAAGTIDPERRSALTEVLDMAKRMAEAIARPGNANELNMKEEI